MTVPLTYAGLQAECLSVIARGAADTGFTTLFPRSVSYAEQRIHSLMPWLSDRAQDSTLSTVAGQRTLSLMGTALPCVVPQRIALVVTPSNSTPAAAGQFIQAFPTSLDWIDMFWPIQGAQQNPAQANAVYWANVGGYDTDLISPTIVIAPTPDAAYPVVVTGLFQQQSLVTSINGTYISTLYPELLMAACMVFISGALLRNYAAAGIPGTSTPDEPGQPLHWEAQFNVLLKAAQSEEMRRRGQGFDWLDRPIMPPVAAQKAV